MSKGVKVRVADKGYNKLVKQVFGMGKPSISVGIFAAEGATKDGLLTVLEVATFNEFGTSRIPERSFLRAYIDENTDRLFAMCAALLKAVLAGKYTKEQALELLGLKMVGEIQARISSGISPPNAPSTIARKGSSTPLIGIGTMRSSITHKVTG